MTSDATPSIHDNDVLGYTVDVEARTIVIRTEFRDVVPRERTDVCFDGVVGYHLRDGLGGILNAITVDDIDDFVARNEDALREFVRYGVVFQGVAYEGLAQHLRDRGATVFQIHSSIGFDGFVAAAAMRVVRAS